MQETEEMQVRFLGREDPLEEEVATHANILSGKFHGACRAKVHEMAKSWT